MNKITSLFVRAKHWQIFFLLFGLFIVCEVAVILSISATARSPQDFLKMERLVGIMVVLSMFFILGWFWSVGSFLSSIVPPRLKLKMGFFRFAVTYPALYVLLFLALLQSASTRPAIVVIIFPLHFLAMFCLFYDNYFVAKNLLLAETGKPASFSEYAGPFFLFWFFLVGIWFIQPRINRLFGRPTVGFAEVGPGTCPSGSAALVQTATGDAGGASIEAPTVYANFWLRVVATFVDCLVMLFPLLYVIAALMLAVKMITQSGHDFWVLAVLAAVTILAVWFYFAALESSRWQATLGKMAVGLRVADMQGTLPDLGPRPGPKP